MQKKYLIFDLDWTLIESMNDTLKIVINYLDKIPNIDIEKVKYVLETTPWMSLQNQLEIIFEWKNQINIEKIKNEIYKDILDNNDDDFFEWVISKIKELSKKHKLFLTTWNSTKTAIKYLTKWTIIDCFELIYWSDKILKWMDHLNIFKDYSKDKDFFEKSIYTWDWNMDRIFAKEAWIDFIHIWNDKTDKYEINSVKNIDSILILFNN